MFRPSADDDNCCTSECICRAEVGRNVEAFGYCSTCDVFVCDVCRKTEESVLLAQESALKPNHVVSGRRDCDKTCLKTTIHEVGVGKDDFDTGPDPNNVPTESKGFVQDNNKKDNNKTELKENQMVSDRVPHTSKCFINSHLCLKEPKYGSLLDHWRRLICVMNHRKSRNLPICRKVTEHRPGIN